MAPRYPAQPALAHPPHPRRAIDTPSGQEGMCHAWIGLSSLQLERLSKRGLEAMQVAVLFGQILLGCLTTRFNCGCASEMTVSCHLQRDWRSCQVEVHVRHCSRPFCHWPPGVSGAVIGQWSSSLDNTIDSHLPLLVGMQTFDRLNKT